MTWALKNGKGSEKKNGRKENIPSEEKQEQGYRYEIVQSLKRCLNLLTIKEINFFS